MIKFADGIVVTDLEHKCMLHVLAEPEKQLLEIVAGKVEARRSALIKEWQSTLHADDSITELPAAANALAELIMARSDYKTRLEQDAAADPPVITDRTSITAYEAVDRSGTTVTLFDGGITIDDTEANCILAYVQDLDNWIISSVMTHVNLGRRRMITKYHPIILDDPDVTTMPGTEDGLVTMILARSDYQSAA